MNSISPYTIRCFDPLKKGQKSQNHYSPLGTIGQFDTYKIIKEFIKSKGNNFHIIEESKQIYKFNGFKFSDATRQFTGVIQAGSFGTKSDIINIKTGGIDFTKLQDNAEVFEHYVRFFVPDKLNEGVVLLHNHKNTGIKTLLYDLIRAHFNNKTGRVLQMNPLAYEKAFNDWKNAAAKEIKLIRFKGMGAIEDQIAKLGHNEFEADVIIKAPRKMNLGVLSDYFKQGSDQLTAIEVLTPLCTEVKTVVELQGRKRTFRLGSNPTGQVCEIDVDEEKVTIIAGTPKFSELHNWCTELLNDFLASIYPGMGIKL